MKIIETHDGLKAVLELDEEEIKWWRKTIGQVRKSIIPAPVKSVENYFDQNLADLEPLIAEGDISLLIKNVRSGVWETFIDYEIQFFSKVIGILLKERNVPIEILTSIINDETKANLISSKNSSELLSVISSIFQDYTGRIFPYFYELSKSQTNSRRSRAGSEFEAIVDQIMRRLDIPYASQSHIGQKLFDEKGLGKKVDGVIPSMEAFNESRSHCIIATMKTTIRERWQEVVEELNRTNIPSIYLLTLDNAITENTLNIMKNHNMTLVTYKDVKAQFTSFTNIMDFETFFNNEIPHTLDWWIKNNPSQLKKME